MSTSEQAILELLRGKEAKPRHPVMSQAPQDWYPIDHVRMDTHCGELVVWLRNEQTAWFRLDACTFRDSKEGGLL